MKKIVLIFVLSLLFWGGSKIDLTRSKIEGCPFCQQSVLDRQLVYHGEHASVLATHKPAVPGHLLIIPNRHVETFDQLETEEILEMGDLVKKVHAQFALRFGADDYVLIQKNGRSAGQTVPHVHIHILPRSAKVGQVDFILRFLISPWLKPFSDQEMKEYTHVVGFGEP